jgi:hypothetical protein
MEWQIILSLINNWRVSFIILLKPGFSIYWLNTPISKRCREYFVWVMKMVATDKTPATAALKKDINQASSIVFHLERRHNGPVVRAGAPIRNRQRVSFIRHPIARHRVLSRHRRP